MDDTTRARPGMPVYSADGQVVGTVSAVFDDGIEVAGQRILSGMIVGQHADGVRVNYTAAQLAWQRSAPPEAGMALTDDPAGRGELTDRLEEERTRTQRQ